MSVDHENNLKEPFLLKEQNQKKIDPNFSKNSSKIAKFFEKNYLYTGLIVGLCYGAYHFTLFLSVGQVLELRMLYLIQIVNLIYYVLYHSYFAVESKQKYGSFWSQSRSSYFLENGNLNRFVLFALVSKSIIQYLSQYVLYYILVTSVRSGISNSIIISIYGTSSILCAIAFYFVFNEKLGIRHIIGILAVTASIILIANGRYEIAGNALSKNAGVSEENKLTALIPISLAIINCCFFVVTALITRVIKVSKLSIFQYAADSQFLVSITFSLQALISHLFFESYTFYEFYLVFISSLFMVIAQIFFAGSAAYGQGGLVQAMLNIQSPFQMLLEMIFLKLYPAFMGVLGMIVCLFGALFIILTKK
ncbi:UNKNOWN [Stylonychia lemnae]|uniref:EamA domain-containing protein n=1 Tax=Stylonychia lemnae TaxID=5949 RepID=A0A078ASZ1_STYLE|nr:UNKNOWN [Stylonychia lemnae]|eukprot:CDW85136.1 UNKNOWN [Stylonychia lemnae]